MFWGPKRPFPQQIRFWPPRGRLGEPDLSYNGLRQGGAWRPSEAPQGPPKTSLGGGYPMGGSKGHIGAPNKNYLRSKYLQTPEKYTFEVWFFLFWPPTKNWALGGQDTPLIPPKTQLEH